MKKETKIYPRTDKEIEHLLDHTLCPNCHKMILPEENPKEGEFWCSECGYEL